MQRRDLPDNHAIAYHQPADRRIRLEMLRPKSDVRAGKKLAVAADHGVALDMAMFLNNRTDADLYRALDD